MARSFLGKGWRFPVRVGENSKIKRAEYEDSVRQAIWIILGIVEG